VFVTTTIILMTLMTVFVTTIIILMTSMTVFVTTIKILMMVMTVCDDDDNIVNITTGSVTTIIMLITIVPFVPWQGAPAASSCIFLHKKSQQKCYGK